MFFKKTYSIQSPHFLLIYQKNGIKSDKQRFCIRDICRRCIDFMQSDLVKKKMDNLEKI